MRSLRSLLVLSLAPLALARAATPTEDWHGSMFAGTPMQVQHRILEHVIPLLRRAGFLATKDESAA